MTTKISFKPKQVTKKLLSGLHDRAHDVIVNRFGLNEDADRKTLEAIGQEYGITRERVRQIENAALSSIRKAETFKEAEAIFDELKSIMDEMGGVVPEEDLLSTLSKDPVTQNHLHLYLVLGDDFKKEKEDDSFVSHWSIDEGISEEVRNSLHSLYKSLSDDQLLSEAELVARFCDELKGVSEKYKDDEVTRRWLGLSKKIAQNPLGEWGKSDSSNVKTRGIKDYAFLMMRKHGSPLHFREVASGISNMFGKKTHVATTHNELIKDARFVLVGRGMYGLSEWGYSPGVVRDVIKQIIKKEGPLSKEDIVEKVLKERYLKKNTILVNLQNAKYFKKNKNGLYAIA